MPLQIRRAWWCDEFTEEVLLSVHVQVAVRRTHHGVSGADGVARLAFQVAANKRQAASLVIARRAKTLRSCLVAALPILFTGL